MIEQDVYTILNNGLDCAVYPNGGVPESAVFPHVTYELISDEWQPIQAGNSGIAETTMQIDVWAESLDSALTEAENVRTILDFYVAGNIKYAHLSNRSTDYEAPKDATSKGKHRQTLTFYIWHI